MSAGWNAVKAGPDFWRSENDSVVTDADFDDVFHTSFGTGLDFFFADLAGSVGNVDGVFANTFTEALQASRRTAGLNNRCREVGVFAESFSNDGSVRQNGGGTSNLNLVASLCSTRRMRWKQQQQRLR